MFQDARATSALAASGAESRVKNSITACARSNRTGNAAAKGVRNVVAEALIE